MFRPRPSPHSLAAVEEEHIGGRAAEVRRRDGRHARVVERAPRVAGAGLGVRRVVAAAERTHVVGHGVEIVEAIRARGRGRGRDGAGHAELGEREFLEREFDDRVEFGAEAAAAGAAEREALEVHDEHLCGVAR
jgi:hypothetical protein